MSNEKTTQDQGNAPQKAVKRVKKPIDLATAHVADGAIISPKSVYEIVGISTNSYKTGSYAEYQESLASMSLMQLQEEAFKCGTPATDNRAVIIDRLERKFLQENARFGTGSKTAKKDLTPAEELRRQAQNIMNRGR